jgi:hypothetical protein
VPARQLANEWAWPHRTTADWLAGLVEAGELIVVEEARGPLPRRVRLTEQFRTLLSIFARYRPVFFPGWHQVSDVARFRRGRMCLNVNRFRQPSRWGHWRVSQPEGSEDVELLLDSGAFSEIHNHGRHRTTMEEYAEQAQRLAGWFKLQAAVTQDYMCEDVILSRTGLSVRHHQALTIARYLDLLHLLKDSGVYLMPVLQGYQIDEYLRHMEDYGPLLAHGAWVGVGSVCKRNGSPRQTSDVLMAIHDARPDLRLHGFGLKLTALEHPVISRVLYSADSLASSLAERKAGRNANDHRVALAYAERVEGAIDRALQIQPVEDLFGGMAA